jgi:sigma-54 specific flagellar transcriptional regulator A
VTGTTVLDNWRTRCAVDILGESAPLRRALDVVRRVAVCDSSILLTGETGSGKELFARAIHHGSARDGKAFVAVNCAAIPESLIESELFGHLRGSFTGASTPRSGRFVAANGGTIFLDEIGDLPLAAQAKLLRVLEQRTVFPVGADNEVPVDVRVVAATHRDLEEMVSRGQFRADLYFRLSVVPLDLPSLRVRGNDILLLAEAAIRRVVSHGARMVTLDASARASLLDYAWPGNVRELNHVVERAVVLADGPSLSASDLGLVRGAGPAVAARGTGPIPSNRSGECPANTTASIPVLRADADDSGLDLRTALEGLERKMIRDALERAHGNRTEAATLLGLNRTTLVEKLRKYA